MRICEDLNYYSIVLSMKASNPRVMVQAYRLLINKMIAAGMNYPLHLGVTEAGDGEDGRIKSAAGIGALLEDGIGDTIRVSLTEEPEFEAPVAIAIVNRYKERKVSNPVPPLDESVKNPFEYSRWATDETASIGGTAVPKVVADLSRRQIKSPAELESIGYIYDEAIDKWKLTDTAADILYAGDNLIPFGSPAALKIMYNYRTWKKLEDRTSGFPLYTLNDYCAADEQSFLLNFVSAGIKSLSDNNFEKIKNDRTVVIILETTNTNGAVEQRRFFFELIKRGFSNPVIIRRNYGGTPDGLILLYSSTDLGFLLIDGLGDGIWLNSDKESPELINRVSFGILQAVRARISKTEYIACPSCGRTLFDLVEVTNRIRKRTGHLKGVKIAIMGCIVNGPGEMADADFGYVGAGPGKITLYKGKEVVKRNLNSDLAVEELITLIKENGMWVDKD